METEQEIDTKEETYAVKDLKRDTKYEVTMKTKNRYGWSLYGKSVSVRTKNMCMWNAGFFFLFVYVLCCL